MNISVNELKSVCAAAATEAILLYSQRVPGELAPEAPVALAYPAAKRPKLTPQRILRIQKKNQRELVRVQRAAAKAAGSGGVLLTMEEFIAVCDEAALAAVTSFTAKGNPEG